MFQPGSHVCIFYISISVKLRTCELVCFDRRYMLFVRHNSLILRDNGGSKHTLKDPVCETSSFIEKCSLIQTDMLLISCIKNSLLLS